jgi:transposase-like protein
MERRARTFTREFKIAAIKEIESGKPVGLVARRLQVGKDLLYRWHKEYKKKPTKAFSGHGKAVNVSREAELERKIGQMAMEIDFLKKVLARLEEQQEASNGSRQYSRKSVRKAKG